MASKAEPPIATRKDSAIDCPTPEVGQQLTLAWTDATSYRLLKNLGGGGSATVEMVQDVNSDKVYARKVFRNVHARNMKKVQEQYNNEIDIIQRLKKHHHVIRVHASYMEGRDISLILEPVADGGDLSRFMQDIWDADRPTTPNERKILWRAIGCLASGLEFMHSQAVRHKDIKPQNILIHRGCVVYTDFGISYDSSYNGNSTTLYNPGAYTLRYCAPEVADWAPRNRKTDVFSLGCVFLEIIQLLYPGLLPEELFEGNFHQNIESIQAALQSYLDKASTASASGHYIPVIFQCCMAMLQVESKERFTACDIVYNIRIADLFSRMFCVTCQNVPRKPKGRFECDTPGCNCVINVIRQDIRERFQPPES